MRNASALQRLAEYLKLPTAIGFVYAFWVDAPVAWKMLGMALAFLGMPTLLLEYLIDRG